MSTRPRWILAACALSVTLAAASDTHAYSFSVRDFTLTTDASVFATDDFEDGTIDSLWGITSGTLVESGGTLTLQIPGESMTPMLRPGDRVEVIRAGSRSSSPAMSCC